MIDFCEKTLQPFPHKVICVFDRDDKRVYSTHKDLSKPYKSWGNNVFSIVLPKPTIKGFPEYFCIGQYFSEKEIKTEDENGRRLFLSNEFDKNTGRHLTQPSIKYGEKSPSGSYNYLRKEFTRVLSDNVWNDKGSNIALTKRDFANNIYINKKGFDHFDFRNFEGLFRIIEEIISI